MSRVDRDFHARPPEEQEWIIQNSWCDACGKADLGIENPQEYSENGRIYVEGLCRGCSDRVCSEVVVKGE